VLQLIVTNNTKPTNTTKFSGDLRNLFHSKLNLQVRIEISLGFEWGNPNSKIEQTERNKETWEQMAKRAKAAEERGWIVEIPNELPDISGFPLDDLYKSDEE